jgi:hypothetical protein
VPGTDVVVRRLLETVLISPRTDHAQTVALLALLRWHRDLVRRTWALFGRRGGAGGLHHAYERAA